MLSRPVGMSLTALLFVCFVACCLAVAERRLLSGGSPLPLTRPVFPEPLDSSPRPAESRMRRQARSWTASRWQDAASSSSSSSSHPFHSWSSARSSSRRHSQRPHHDHRHPTFWRVEEGLTLRLWKDSSHVSPRLLALRYRGAPGGMDARDLVPLGEEDSQNNEADGARDVRNCFYSGDVVGEPGSKAVVSLCNGMTGYISSPSRGMFTVEPINWDGSDADHQGTHGAHILRHHRDGYVSTANNASSTHGPNSGEAVYVFGGISDGHVLADVLLLQKGRWTLCAHLQASVLGPSVVALPVTGSRCDGAGAAERGDNCAERTGRKDDDLIMWSWHNL